jgi:capsular exopolysaccharide synthesis family protein
MSDYHLTPRSDQAPAEWSGSQALGRPSDGGWPDQGWEERGSSFDWRQLVAAIWRHKWMVVVGALLGAGAGYFAFTRVSTGLYRATGSLWLQPRPDPSGPIVTGGLLQTPSWLALIESNAVLDTVVMKHKLYVTSSPAAKPLLDSLQIVDQLKSGAYTLRVAEQGSEVVLLQNGVEVERGLPGSTFGTTVGFKWTPPPSALTPGREIAFTLRTPRQAATRLAEELQPVLDPAGTIIKVSMTGPDPDLLEGVVNDVLDRHVELAADLKSGHLREQTQVLRQQLASAQAELERSMAALEEFRVRTITLAPEQGAMQPGLQMTTGPVFNQFFEMKVRQDETLRDRQRLESVLARTDSAFPVEAIEAIPSVIKSSQLKASLDQLVTARLEREKLLATLTPEHTTVKEVDARIRGFEQGSIPSLIRQLIGQLDAEERQLEARIAASGQDLSTIPTRTIQEESLRRAVTIADALYTELRQRYEFSNLAQQTSMPDVRVIERAGVEELPRTADRRAVTAIAIFLIMVGAGMGGAIAIDRMDPRMRTPDQVTTMLGLPILGVVPRIRRGAAKDESMDQAREAFRSLRTNIEFAYGSAGPMVLAVSSPGQSEGKTLVTSNLGMCFAELGRRTLIIDGDTRRGDLHRALMGERKPGLTDYLRGKATPEDVLQVAGHSNLNFVGSGTQVANSPELLSSSRMGELLGEMRKRYDVILVDCPPLGVGADALVLGSLTANLLLLFRSGSTHIDFAQARLEPLGRLPLRLLGAVLNDFQPDRLAANYYSSYYGNYLPGYEAGSEEEDEPALEGEPA